MTNHGFPLWVTAVVLFAVACTGSQESPPATAGAPITTTPTSTDSQEPPSEISSSDPVTPNPPIPIPERLPHVDEGAFAEEDTITPTSVGGKSADLPDTFPAFILASSIAFPEHTALFIESGCSRCDAPPDALELIYRDIGGVVRSRELFTTGDRNQGEPYINYGVMGFGTGRLLVVQCSSGKCGGVGFASTDAATLLYESSDGGTTWMQTMSLDGAYWLVDAIAPDALLMYRYPTVDEPFSLRVEAVPEHEYLAAPAGVDDPLRVVLGLDGVPLWPKPDGSLISSTGETVLDLSGEFVFGDIARIQDVLFHRQTRRAAVLWDESATADPSYSRQRLSIVSLDSGQVATFVPPTALSNLGAWASENRIIVNMVLPADLLGAADAPSGALVSVPARLDLTTLTLTPIRTPFIEARYLHGRNSVVDVYTSIGQLRTVTSADGSCAPVFRDSSARSEEVGCVAPGALVDSFGSADEEDGLVRVRAISGEEGWMSLGRLNGE